MMSEHIPKEALCLKCLLSLKLTPNLKWNAYIVIVKDAGRMVSLLYPSRKYQTLAAMIYLYKSLIR